jgi:hypothetical protein
MNGGFAPFASRVTREEREVPARWHHDVTTEKTASLLKSDQPNEGTSHAYDIADPGHYPFDRRTAYLAV